jgi:hypothetical protein
MIRFVISLRRTAAATAVVIAAGALAPPVAAQSSRGTTSATVLQMPAGGRAAGFGGAYTAAADGDVLFYNPAGAAWLSATASMAYQRHSEQIGFGTAAASLRIGPAAAALTLGVLDYGSIAEVVPDPAFGGQRGMETGAMVGASDVVARIALAAPIPGSRLAVGASFGLVWITLAESVRTAEIYDAGLHYRAGDALSIGAALRNAGAQLEGAGLVPADLPTEVRAGAAWALPVAFTRGVQVRSHLDLIAPLNEGGRTFAIGVEGATESIAGVMAGGHPLGAAVRAGFNGAPGTDAAGRLHAGAGLTLGSVSLDYALQRMNVLGMTHRIGVRWGS